jgi:uncharacterized OB-fold protein
MAGIASAGVAAPRYRVPRDAYEDAWGRFAARGVESKAVPAHDEDRVTLAVAAGRDALEAGPTGAAPSLAVLATADEAPRAEPVGEALGLGEASLEVLTGSPARGVQALARARDHAAAADEPALVLAAAAPRGRPDESAEHGLGAGAAALLVTPEGSAGIGPAAGRTREALGGGRRDADGLRRDHPVGARTREVLGEAVADAAEAADGEPAAVAAHPAGAHGLDAEAATGPRAAAGDLLAAAPLASLVQVLADPPESPTVVAAAGAGDAAAHPVHAAGPVPRAEGGEAAIGAAERIPWDEALRQRELLPPYPPDEEPPMGAHVPMDDFNATAGNRYRLVGERCTGCGTLHFPPRPTCLECHGTDFEDEPLEGPAEVVASTTIGRGGAPSEFAREQRLTGSYDVAVVELEEGPRVVARLADADPGEADIGDEVEPVFRRLYEQEGAVRYGTKYRPR